MAQSHGYEWEGSPVNLAVLPKPVSDVSFSAALYACASIINLSPSHVLPGGHGIGMFQSQWARHIPSEMAGPMLMSPPLRYLASKPAPRPSAETKHHGEAPGCRKIGTHEQAGIPG